MRIHLTSSYVFLVDMLLCNWVIMGTAGWHSAHAAAGTQVWPGSEDLMA